MSTLDNLIQTFIKQPTVEGEMPVQEQLVEKSASVDDDQQLTMVVKPHIIGKMELPDTKNPDTTFECIVDGEVVPSVAFAMLPPLEWLEEELGHLPNVDDFFSKIKNFLVCVRHVNEVAKEAGIRFYSYKSTRNKIEELQKKRNDEQQRISAAAQRFRPHQRQGELSSSYRGGRDFDSSAASKPRRQFDSGPKDHRHNRYSDRGDEE